MSVEKISEETRALCDEVKSLINRNSAAQGLQTALASLPAALPPTGSDDVKQLVAETMLSLFTSIPTSSIDSILEDTPIESRETIMKYTYRCMKIADKKACEMILIWHSKIVAKDGHGMIARALFDKRL